MEGSNISQKTPTPKKTWKQRGMAVLIISVFILVGLAGAKYMLSNKPQANKRPPQKMSIVVDTKRAERIDTYISVRAMGRLKADRELSLVPQVSGRIVYVNPNLFDGAVLKKGTTAVKIDESDYKIAVKKAESTLAQAVADYQLELGSQQVAKKEWEILSRQTDMEGEPSDLALRKPQLKKAMAAVKSAEAALESAKLNLMRTNVIVPFDSVVLKKNAVIGTMIQASQTVASLAGVSMYKVEITVPVEKLQVIRTSSENGKPASPVKITTKEGGEYKAQIQSVSPDVESGGMMAKMSVIIKNPIEKQNSSKPLLLGSFVNAQIQGKKLQDIFRIKREHVTPEGEILINKDGTLDIRQVSSVWKDEHYLYIKDGIENGEKLITSRVPAPVQGMKVVDSSDNKKQKNPQKKDKMMNKGGSK